MQCRGIRSYGVWVSRLLSEAHHIGRLAVVGARWEILLPGLAKVNTEKHVRTTITRGGVLPVSCVSSLTEFSLSFAETVVAVPAFAFVPWNGERIRYT
jgi:hypothetical protein